MTKREKALKNILQQNELRLQSKSMIEMQKSMHNFKKMVDSGLTKNRGYNILSVGEPQSAIAFNVKG
ncbi:MAG: hypothetical protein IKI67_06430 [Bacteroidales bacterium]|nr:hypothetical protein [Bacteroidales bacterium]